MNSRTLALRSAAVLFVALVVPSRASSQERTPLERAVFEAERAFAKTLADRDLEAFRGHVAEEAIFFGDDGALTGRGAIVEGWRPFFEAPAAPFSWDPDTVVVLASGSLAHSSGPVYDPAGTRVGTFNSVWRLEADGRWRVVFDKGCSCGG